MEDYDPLLKMRSMCRMEERNSTSKRSTREMPFCLCMYQERELGDDEENKEERGNRRCSL
jgi:hypothetical protein